MRHRLAVAAGIAFASAVSVAGLSPVASATPTPNPKPVITSFQVMPETESEAPAAGVGTTAADLYNIGGVVLVQGVVNDARFNYTYSSSKPLAGLPTSGSSNSNAGVDVVIPPNTGKRNIVYRIKFLVVAQDGKKASSRVTITVSPTSPPSGPLHISPGDRWSFIDDPVDNYCDIQTFGVSTYTDSFSQGTPFTYQQTADTLSESTGSRAINPYTATFYWSPPDNSFLGSVTFSTGNLGVVNLNQVAANFTCQAGPI